MKKKERIRLVVARRPNQRFVPLPADSPDLNDPKKVFGVVNTKPSITPKRAGRLAAWLNLFQGLDDKDE